MLLAVFEPTIPASQRPQTHALDRAATGVDKNISGVISYFALFTKLYVANSL
jgi:hypothetical protein